MKEPPSKKKSTAAATGAKTTAKGKSTLKGERRAGEPTDGAGAAKLFEERTGFDLTTDPLSKAALNMAVIAELLDALVDVDKWAESFRVLIRREENPPGVPDLLAKIGAVLGVEPAARVDMKNRAGQPTQMEVGDLIRDVKKHLDAFRDSLEWVRSITKDLSRVQIDQYGRAGTFIEPRRANRPAREAKLRFARRLDHEWRKAGRPALGSTEMGLAAVYLGLDSLAGGLAHLTDRWSAQLRRDRALTKKRVAAGERRMST